MGRRIKIRKWLKKEDQDNRHKHKITKFGNDWTIAETWNVKTCKTNALQNWVEICKKFNEDIGLQET